MDYTKDDFKILKRELKLTNKDIADIVGLEPTSVNTMLSKNRELPTWAKSMIYGYRKGSFNKPSND